MIKNTSLFFCKNNFEVFEYILEFCTQEKLSFEIHQGNLVVSNTNLENCAHLSCHVDNVHNSLTKNVVFWKDMIYSPQGISGDDLSGVWIALQVLKTKNPVKVIFCDLEESGCQGSERLPDSFFGKIPYIINLDRKGNSDCITSIGLSGNLCSRKFKKEIKPIVDYFGYSFQSGLISDNLTWKERLVQSINLSVGYYKPHTKGEYIVISDMVKALKLTICLVQNITLKKWRLEKEAGFNWYSRYDQNYTWFDHRDFNRIDYRINRDYDRIEELNFSV